jgi:hypothetical protein
MSIQAQAVAAVAKRHLEAAIGLIANGTYSASDARAAQLSVAIAAELVGLIAGPGSAQPCGASAEQASADDVPGFYSRSGEIVAAAPFTPPPPKPAR